MTDTSNHVSVVIPAHNGMDYLPTAVDSVLRQTHRNLEVIIVDNGSTDSTRAWAQSVSDPRVRYFYQENTGSPTGSRNAGIEQASGPIIAFLDCDDTWAPSKLERQLKLLQPANVGLVYCGAFDMDLHGNILGRKDTGTPNRGWVLAELLRNNFICCSSVALKKQNLLDHNLRFQNGRPCAEDWDLWLRLAGVCEFDYVPEGLVHYRRHEGNTSGDIDLIHQSGLTVLEEVIRRETGNASIDEQTRKRLLLAYRRSKSDTHLRYGHRLHACGRRSEAIRVMLKVIRQRPAYAKGWWGLSKCVLKAPKR